MLLLNMQCRNRSQTVVVEIACWKVDEVLFFWSLDMKITCILAENSLYIQNCGVRNNSMRMIKRLTMP